MASAKANRKMAAVAVELPECPVCMETMTAPIYQCLSGHSLCQSCSKNLPTPFCPICRQGMTQMRNWQLEEIISKAQVPCTNKSSGCQYTMMIVDLEEHLKECIFREMDCPLGVVFGKCSWKGKLKDIMDHFKDRHPSNCNVSTDSEVEIDNLNIKEDDRYFYLIGQGKFLYTLTMKIDTIQKMVFWAVQLIGSKNAAKQSIYEIHVTSKKDNRRKIVFIEHCFNDSIKADEVFREGKCGVLPLDNLKHFIKDNKISFRFFIKRLPAQAKNKNDKGEEKNENKPPNNKGPKGPGPKAPFHKGQKKQNKAQS